MEYLGFLGFVFILSYLAFRSNFFGLKLMAGCAWTAWVLYCIAHPPFGLTAGEPAHVAVILVSVGIGLMVVAAGLGRGIQRSEDSSGNFSVSGEGFQWKLPDWLKGSEAKQREQQARRQADLEAYRNSLHRALHPRENERRGR